MRLLLLAGTLEARHIAIALSREAFLSVTVALPEAERRPQGYGWPVRIGGWRGVEEFRDWLVHEGVEGIVDASHPFAGEQDLPSADVAQTLGIPHVRYLRPAWMPTTSDNWIFLNDEVEAARHIPEDARVFLATGRRQLSKFENMGARELFCRIRSREERPFPLNGGRYLLQQPPFSVAEEIGLFSNLGIDWVVARNSGGQGSWPKIEAARELQLPVAMIRRPPQPDTLKIATVAETLAWVRRRV
ncbi:MAG: precorrin-6A/cobalt-precorrin-6A reductase [Paracoccaceae bacterium]|nr:precorrin-6A/cobalt-precorrin-6A reductase [Paracoccaceae bacterium]